MKFFLVHCGFYDRTLSAGIFEAHADFLIAAEDFRKAREATKALPEFKERKMHIDGIVRVDAVQGHRVELVKDEALDGKTLTDRTPEKWDAMNT